MPRRRNNKRNKNKKQEYKVIKIDKDHPPPKDLLHHWLVDGDMKPLSAMVELNWHHLINEPYKYRNDAPPEIMFLKLCADDIPIRSMCWMVNNGADLRAKDECGATAMHFAAMAHRCDNFDVLMATEDADWMLNQKDVWEYTPMDIVRHYAEQEEAEEAEEDAPFAESVPIVEAEPVVEAEALVEE